MNHPHTLETAGEPADDNQNCCSACGAPLDTAVYCFSCQTIQKDPVADHFQLFGLPRDYDIDRSRLDAIYERLSLVLQPDFFATADPGVKKVADLLAAQLNDGYRVLSSDPARAAYLVRLWASGRDLDTKMLPDGFLQEMFLLQEEVDEWEESDREGLERLRGIVDAGLKEGRSQQAALFASAGDPPDVSRLQAIQTNLNQEHYLVRLWDRLKGIEH